LFLKWCLPPVHGQDRLFRMVHGCSKLCTFWELLPLNFLNSSFFLKGRLQKSEATFPHLNLPGNLNCRGFVQPEFWNKHLSFFSAFPCFFLELSCAWRIKMLFGFIFFICKQASSGESGSWVLQMNAKSNAEVADLIAFVDKEQTWVIRACLCDRFTSRTNLKQIPKLWTVLLLGIARSPQVKSKTSVIFLFDH